MVAFLLRKYKVFSPQYSLISSLDKLAKDCFEMLERVWDWFLDKRGHIVWSCWLWWWPLCWLTQYMDLTWHKHYKPPRPKLKDIILKVLKLIICLKRHLGSSVLESRSTDSVTKTPITPGGKQAEEKILCLNMLFFVVWILNLFCLCCWL